LRRISVEYVLSAVRYLAALPEVDPTNVSVWGASRGGELALLVGAFGGDEVRGVIAQYGSPWVYGGCCPPTYAPECAWTYGGACLPYLTRIPVEQVRGPVLLIAGQYDAVWPLAYTEQISAQLDAAHHPHQLTVFPNVGHGFGAGRCFIAASRCTEFPGLSSTRWDANAYVHATRVTFAQVVAFLRALAAGSPAALPTIVPRELVMPPVATPASAGPKTAVSGTVLLRDALTDPATGTLPKQSNEPGRYTRGYVADAYAISLRASPVAVGGAPNHAEAVLPGTYGDASIAVRARLENPLPDQAVTLACRSERIDREYVLMVMPATGTFQLLLWTPPTAWTLTGEQPSTHIRPGSANNLLELSCHGRSIEAAINGERVASVSDYTLGEGRMWIGVRQRTAHPELPTISTEPGTAIRGFFTDLVLIQQ
jgi:dienelactone hydrolase